MKTKLNPSLLLCAACLAGGIAQAASLGPAALVSGAARLDNDSLVTLGQPFVGLMSGGGVTLSAGLGPALSAATSLPAPPVLGSVARLADGAFRFTFVGQTGRHYAVEASTNLAPGSWIEVQAFNGTGGPLSFTDAQAGNHPQRFYRVRIR